MPKLKQIPIINIPSVKTLKSKTWIPATNDTINLYLELRNKEVEEKRKYKEKIKIEKRNLWDENRKKAQKEWRLKRENIRWGRKPKHLEV